MSLLAVALVFVHSLFAINELSGSGVYFNCSKISGSGDALLQAKTNCIATGWCFWLAGACYYDNVLKSVTKAEYEANPNAATLCTDTNGQGSQPSLYYLTEVHSCDSACTQTDVENIYCRENNPTFEHNVIDECFYADLKYRADPNHGAVPKVENSWCKINDTYKENAAGREEAGFYVYSDSNVQDCSTLSNQADVCDCLGTEWCNLHPRCTLNKAKNACIKDPCSDNAAGTTTNSDCTPNFAGCTTSKNQQRLNAAGTGIETYRLCVSTSSNTIANVNNDTNECFYAYAGFVTQSTVCPEPDCATFSQVDKCTSGYVNNEDGTVDQETPCTLADLPGGYFPTNKYCNDGRKVPVIAAASLVQMRLLLVFVGLLALFV